MMKGVSSVLELSRVYTVPGCLGFGIWGLGFKVCVSEIAWLQLKGAG